MTKERSWTPDKEAALKALIRQTIDAVGGSDPQSLPHRVKEQLKGRATGDLDVEAYVREVLREQRRN
ncbi:MAG: hypothetical protein AB7P23_00235 [Amphiplicatus sp.]